MVEKVRWTKKARKSYFNILDYILANRSVKKAAEFNKKLSNRLLILQTFPQAGINLRSPKAYKRFVLTRHNSIIYRVKNKEIVILNIHDNRQNPKKAKF